MATNEAKYREAEQTLWSSFGLNPTERRVRLERIGATVRIQEVGAGPTILFMHGASTGGATWAPLVPHLNGFHCVLLDRPGCGLSDPLPGRAASGDLHTLEVIADTYLSVAAPVQAAAGALLAGRSVFQQACRQRLASNRDRLARGLESAPELELLPADGGWSACVRIPAVDDEETVALELLEKDRVAVHPGFFYDFAEGAHLVLSLLVPEEQFAAGVERMVERLRSG